jgi:hypothetical protein
MTEAMTKHTPGLVEATGNGIHSGARCVALTYMEPREQRQADARRIAACWNACEGIADPAELRAQRDELLAALRAFAELSLPEDHTDYTPDELAEMSVEGEQFIRRDDIRKARAAIAQAERSKS